LLAELPPIVPRAIGRSAAWLRERRTQAAWAGTALVLLAALALVATRAQRQAPLFDAPLYPGQRSEVEQALILWNESFALSSDGSQILVAPGNKRALLLRLMMAGLPRRYVPTSDDVQKAPDNLLTPESVIDDRRRAGIEGDLVSSLRRMAGIVDATVVIAPRSGGLLDDDALRSPSTASVQLIAAPGVRLPPAAIAGIARFVAAAYPGLTAQRVTVVDGSGASLNTAAPAELGASKEGRIQAAVQSALDAVLGDGSAVVRVNARTAGAADTIQSTRVIPHGLLDSDAGREHGTESGRAFDKERSTRRYAYDTIVEKRATPADAIERLSVAVFLDERRVPADKTPAITALVRAAAGADLSAGDDVVVRAMPFVHAAMPLQPAGRRSGVRLRAVVPALVACLIAIAGAYWWPRRAPALHSLPRGEAAAISAHLALEKPHTAAYVLRAMPPDVRLAVLRSCEPQRRAAIQALLEDCADA